MAWINFVLSAAAIVVAAIYLAKFGDVIAIRTRLGGMFIGILLLAGATSLPELLTSIVSIKQGTPNIAAGNLFGSNAFNMLILAILDMIHRSPEHAIEELRCDYYSQFGKLDEFLGKFDLAGLSLCRNGFGELICGAFRFYDNKFYELHSYCVMPNHVHLLIRPLRDKAGEFFKDSVIVQRINPTPRKRSTGPWVAKARCGATIILTATSEAPKTITRWWNTS